MLFFSLIILSPLSELPCLLLFCLFHFIIIRLIIMPLKPLLLKNYFIFKRNCCSSLFQLLLPVVLVLLVTVSLQAQIVSQKIPQTLYISNYSYHSPITPSSRLIQLFTNQSIGVCPKDDPIIKILQLELQQLGYNVTGFQNWMQMQAHIRSPAYLNALKGITVGVVMLNSSFSNYSYQIRQTSGYFSGVSTLRLQSSSQLDLVSFNKYLQNSFLQLQNMIDNIIFQKESGSQYFIRDVVAPVGHAEIIQNNFYKQFGKYFDILPVLSLIIIYLKNVYGIVKEKQSGIKYLMQIMGMRKCHYVLSWFIRYFSSYLLVGIISGSLLTILVENVSPLVFILMYVLLGIVLSLMAYFVSIFFSRPKLATSVASLFYISQYLLVLIVKGKDSDSSIYTAMSLVPLAGFSVTFQAVIFGSSNGAKIGLDSIINSTFLNVPLLSYFLIVPLVGLIYSLLILYLQEVYPNELGTSKHPLFFLGFGKNYEGTDFLPINQTDTQRVKDMEQVPQTSKIRIKGLCRMFAEKKAVDNFSLELYQGEIFSFLGHNGAGKTTTISMLTGVIQPTSGVITYFGRNFHSQIQQLRKIIGYCPQSNTIFEDLTVEQHMQVFALLKQKNVDQEGQRLIQDLGLNQKKDCLASNLSGGQKRKLCMAISFIGGSKVIFLDQPTSGMDPFSRRFVWDVLRKFREDRIIILTTHFMDQADYLGDRVGIIDKGRLVCVGSPLYLKSKYGIGYTLTIAKQSSQASSKQIVKTIKEMMPQCQVLSEVSCQIKLQLPHELSEQFADLFAKLQKNKKSLKIQSYGVSITSLEDVFLRISNSQDRILQENGLRQNTLDQSTSFIKQLKACIWKKLIYLRKDLRSLIFEILLPAAIISVGLLLTKINPVSDLPALQLSQQIYKDFRSFNSMPFPINNSLGFSTPIKSLLQFDQASLQLKNQQLLFSAYHVKNQSQKSFNFYLILNTALSHSPGVALFQSHLAFLRSINPKLQLKVKNNPLPYPLQISTANGLVAGIFANLLFAIALAYFFSSLAILIVKEKQNGCKDLQLIFGLNPAAHWLAHFLVDALKFGIVLCVSMVAIRLYNVSYLVDKSRLSGLAGALGLLGISGMLFVYLLTFIFTQSGSAQLAILLLVIIVQGIVPIFLLLLRLISGKENTSIGVVLWLIRIVPFFSFGELLVNLSSLQIIQLLYQKQVGIYGNEVGGNPMIMLGVMSGVNVVLLILTEMLKRRKCLDSLIEKDTSDQLVQILNQDIQAELNFIQESKDLAVRVQGLRKVYSTISQQFLAVQNISFGVKSRQVFTLLGINGAGKTTTFKMMTAQVNPTKGRVLLMGQDIHEETKRVANLIGYCPQHDALFDILSIREHLQFIADIKGVKDQLRQEVICNLVSVLALKNYQSVKAEELSGGNKRKLCLAMALIGSPPIIFLDEPTTGMDPGARRFVWNVISRLTREQSCTVVLTTHSMEQAQALATKMGIMVRGQFKCVGTVQHIKSRYGQGYQLQTRLELLDLSAIAQKKREGRIELKEVGSGDLKEVMRLLKVDEQSSEDLLKEKELAGVRKGESMHIDRVLQILLMRERIRQLRKIMAERSTCQIIQQCMGFTRFKVGVLQQGVGQLFSVVETIKQDFKVLQYSIKQATVQQVFNKLAEQYPDNDYS